MNDGSFFFLPKVLFGALFFFTNINDVFAQVNASAMRANILTKGSELYCLMPDGRELPLNQIGINYTDSPGRYTVLEGQGIADQFIGDRYIDTPIYWRCDDRRGCYDTYQKHNIYVRTSGNGTFYSDGHISNKGMIATVGPTEIVKLEMNGHRCADVYDSARPLNWGEIKSRTPIVLQTTYTFAFKLSLPREINLRVNELTEPFTKLDQLRPSEHHSYNVKFDYNNNYIELVSSNICSGKCQPGNKMILDMGAVFDVSIRGLKPGTSNLTTTIEVF